MSAYIAQLNAYAKAHCDAQAKEAEAGHAEDALAARERLTPLYDRLSRLLSSIPVEVQREGLSLPALQVMLKGRWRGSCHPGDLGKALRRLNWMRRRSWGEGGEFSALWFPPD